MHNCSSTAVSAFSRHQPPPITSEHSTPCTPTWLPPTPAFLCLGAQSSWDPSLAYMQGKQDMLEPPWTCKAASAKWRVLVDQYPRSLIPQADNPTAYNAKSPRGSTAGLSPITHSGNWLDNTHLLPTSCPSLSHFHTPLPKFHRPVSHFYWNPYPGLALREPRLRHSG